MKLDTWFICVSTLLFPFLIPKDLQGVQGQDHVFDDQEVKGKVIVHHVIKEILTNSDTSCRIKCHLIPRCLSYNLGPSAVPGMMICQLNDVDRYQSPLDYQDRPGHSYRAISKPCMSSMDSELAGFDKTQEKCACFQGYTGRQCQKDDSPLSKREWMKISQAPVCIGAKDDTFGTVEIPLYSKKKQLKLVHLSGSVSWSRPPRQPANWGDKSQLKRICIFITDSNNTRILPTSGYHSLGRTFFEASGITVTSPELIFPEPLESFKAGQLRFWFTDDLLNHEESHKPDNKTCADVYVRDF